MHDVPPPVRTETTVDGHSSSEPLTPERIDSVLADFRRWLEGLNEDRAVAKIASPEPVDLYTLVAQFTALRHEVNLQTRASRAAVEQTTETIKLLNQPKADPQEILRPLIKALIDIADVLAVSVTQVEKALVTAEELTGKTPPPKRGLFARLFGGSDVATSGQTTQSEDSKRLQSLLAGLGDGYALSLRRIERVLPQFGLETIPSVGQIFDPEVMEVMEVVGDPDRTTGSVIEEVRRGYWWNGHLFRPAQVKVVR